MSIDEILQKHKNVPKAQLGFPILPLHKFIPWILSRRKAKEQPKEETKKVIPIYPSKNTKLNSTSSIHAERIKNDGRFDSRTNWDNTDLLINFFNQNAGYKTSLGVNANVNPESFGNPNQKQIGGGPGRGLIQLEEGTDRYERVKDYPVTKKIDGFNEWGNQQVNYILDAMFENQHKDDWTHGGKGTGYMTGEEARKEFINANSDIDTKTRAFMLGFVRPKDRSDEAVAKRQYLAHSLDSIYNPRFYKENQ